MIEFNFNDKTYNMTTNWNDVTLRQFIRLNKIQESNTIIPLGDEILSQQLIECLCNVEVGEFDEMSMGQASQLVPYLMNIIEGSKKYDDTDYTFGNDYWNIGNKTYSFHKDPNQYSLGEVSDIKTYIQNKKNEWDYLADIAAVMIRPAIKMVTEAGTEYYKLTKRTPFDFEPNKQVILDFNLYDVTRVLRFFLTGLNERKEDTKNYLQIKEVVK